MFRRLLHTKRSFIQFGAERAVVKEIGCVLHPEGQGFVLFIKFMLENFILRNSVVALRRRRVTLRLKVLLLLFKNSIFVGQKC
jgi:hypothetical protein